MASAMIRPMLRLLQAPEWHAGGAPPQTLPGTLPVCLLVRLAAEPSWLDRESLAGLFWPDRPTAEALHNLRVNLHRLRQLLARWDHAEALEAERSRVRLRLPTDLAALDQAAGHRDAAALVRLQPQRWLQGLRVPGFDGFWAWAQQQRQRRLRQWHAAVEQTLFQRLQQDDPAAALALFAARREAEPPSAELRLALDPTALSPAARAAWQQMQARAPVPAAVPAANAPAGFSGRVAELATLRHSRAAAVVVLGEAGVGKTSLLRAAEPQALGLRGREGLDAVPYGPLVELLHQQPALLAHAGAYRLDLARVLPEIAPDEALPPLDAHTAKLRLLEGLARVFEAAPAASSAGAALPVLRVDDLQWCDSSTLEWLVFVAHRGRLRWLASARAHELPAAARQALQALRAAGLLQELALQGLDGDEFGAWCRGRWPAQAWPAPRLRQLRARSAGNPFVAGEIVAAGFDGDEADTTDQPALPPRVRQLIQRRLDGLWPAARAMVEAAAVLSRPASLALLCAVSGLDEAEGLPACEAAVAADLLVEAGGMECRHDLIRAATVAGLSAARRESLHRRAALALAQAFGAAAAPLEVAAHWDQAMQPQTALAWCHRGAQQLKEAGRFDEAQALWQRVAAEALDAALVLRARLALAECELLNDLPAGRDALEAVLDDVGAVAEPGLRAQLEAQALAGLVDNAVFAGDRPRARQLAARLRPLLPGLQGAEQAHACEVLIELAMREPDIPAARELLARARRADPRRPSLLSFEAQIHWFGGEVVPACAAFETLLRDHPEQCRGLTIENDLAVMCHARGDLVRAETMARRSLASWQGVVHTETLSLLVLGSTLTGLGRHHEAGQALEAAAQGALQQSSTLFLAEAQTRQARLLLQHGQAAAALRLLAEAERHIVAGDEPLRLSQWLLTQALCLAAQGQALLAALQAAAQALGERSPHPVVQVRLWRIAVASALQAGDAATALQAAMALADTARRAGLQEWLCEGLLLQARAAPRRRQADRSAWLAEACTLAEAGAYADLAWRGFLLRGDAVGAARAQHWAAQIAAASTTALGLPYDAAAAARRST